MNRKTLLGLVAAGLGGTLGFASLSWGVAAREKALSSELHRQSVALDELLAKVAVSTQTLRSCPQPAAPPDSASQAALRSTDANAVRTAFDSHAGQEETRSEHKQVPTADNLDAFNRATQLVTAGVSAKRWTDKDVAELHKLLAKVTAEQRHVLARRVVVALNKRDMSLQTSTPRMPF